MELLPFETEDGETIYIDPSAVTCVRPAGELRKWARLCWGQTFDVVRGEPADVATAINLARGES